MDDNRVRPTNDFIEFEQEEIEQSIPERFQKQVAKYGDRIAVRFGGHELTYNGLNERANRIARAILEKRGKGQEPVALLLQHGIPMISGAVGVVKSGKMHAPLSPWFPRVRLDYILRDLQASLIVTDSKNLLFARELAQDTVQLLNIDELDSGLSREDLNLHIQPDDFAWLRYTSGSTGQPKGVFWSHRNSLYASKTFINEMHICLHDRLAYFGPPGAGFWRTLLNGASFHRLDIRAEGLAGLANWLMEEEVTIYALAIATFRHFVSTLTEETFPRLRLMCVGAEPIYKRDVELFRQHFSPDCLLVNQMGSTETGLICWYFIDKETQIDGRLVPIGYPLLDMEVLLIDGNGEELGTNQIGEIVVKSRYLSEGYWRKPDLTQARFLPDPDGGDKRIYMLGDLGRMLPDGRFVHLGRKDFQVKIRGYRVEIAEIEMALLDLDGIKEAVVVAREDSHGDQRLIAYLVPTEGSTATVSMLRRDLAEALPDYMIPSAFVMMDVLPLTPNGKINRLALPEPGTARPEPDTSFVAPRTPIENTLAEIWSGVLGLDEVGIHDNFFDLGGNSLLATQIISRAINTFQVRVPLRALFRSPTIADMAVVIARNMAENVESREIEQILAELEKLSEDEIKMMLDDESSQDEAVI
ncbi:AMP-binding protein [Candidatus Poribacteria bacterium]